MQYRKLGRTGLKVSNLCLGTMTFGWSADEAESFAIMDAAFDAGINFFDTADVYTRWIEGNQGGESEVIIGRWLKARNIDRRQIVIATKVRRRMWDGTMGEGLSRLHIIHAVEDSLRRLQTDYIDLYQAHAVDEDTPLDETLSAFDQLVRDGKVRYVGASNYPAWVLTKSLWVSDVKNLVRYESIQPHYSMLHRLEFERELEPLCLDQAIGVIPYSPLAAGFLTGKYTRENRTPDTTRDTTRVVQSVRDDERTYDILDAVTRVANEHNAPISQVALAWMLARPSITSPIIGARKVDQLNELIGAGDLTLNPEALEHLNKVSDGTDAFRAR